MPPAKDTGFFRKPFPATLPTPPLEWGTPQGMSTPVSKSPVQGLWDKVKKTSTVDLTGEEDDDIPILSSKGSTSKVMESGGGLKHNSPPAKKANVEDSGY